MFLIKYRTENTFSETLLVVPFNTFLQKHIREQFRRLQINTENFRQVRKEKK